MFAIIRISPNYRLVLVVAPGERKPGAPGARFFRYMKIYLGNEKPRVFHEITRDEAVSYFRGHSDGPGFMPLPSITFRSLEDVIAYIDVQSGDRVEKLEPDFEVDHGGEG